MFRYTKRWQRAALAAGLGALGVAPLWAQQGSGAEPAGSVSFGDALHFLNLWLTAEAGILIGSAVAAYLLAALLAWTLGVPCKVPVHLAAPAAVLIAFVLWCGWAVYWTILHSAWLAGSVIPWPFWFVLGLAAVLITGILVISLVARRSA